MTNRPGTELQDPATGWHTNSSRQAGTGLLVIPLYPSPFHFFPLLALVLKRQRFFVSDATLIHLNSIACFSCPFHVLFICFPTFLLQSTLLQCCFHVLPICVHVSFSMTSSFLSPYIVTKQPREGTVDQSAQLVDTGRGQEPRGHEQSCIHQLDAQNEEPRSGSRITVVRKPWDNSKKPQWRELAGRGCALVQSLWPLSACCAQLTLSRTSRLLMIRWTWARSWGFQVGSSFRFVSWLTPFWVLLSLAGGAGLVSMRRRFIDPSALDCLVVRLAFNTDPVQS